LAAANALGYRSIGIERDRHYVDMARGAISKLAALTPSPTAPLGP
jgi:DNA modification methylase